MDWFNYYGLIFLAVILIPNIVYAVKNKGGDLNADISKAAVIAEQTGRYGCMIFTVFNIPFTYFNFWFDGALTVYLSVNGALCFAYLISWALLGNKSGLLRALLLSVLPTLIFAFGGIMLLNVPLMIFSAVFGASHIFISVKNAKR